MTDRAALILVEFQHQWTRPGLYHALIRRQLEAGDVVGRAARMASQARAAGVPVIHAPLVLDPAAPRGWFARLTASRVFRRGTPAAELDSRAYQPGDLVARGRYAFDAFVGSDLEDLLRQTRARRVLVCGFTTDQCVARTLRTALARGFDGYLLSDCSATVAGWLQRLTLSRFPGRVVQSGELHLEDGGWAGSARAEPRQLRAPQLAAPQDRP